MQWKDELQLKIFYLFLGADGERVYSEMELFDEICRKKGVSEVEKDSVIQYCHNVLSLRRNKDNSDSIIHILQSVFGSSNGWGQSLEYDKEGQVSTIWNLLNLGNVDKDFSNAERRVVDFLIKHWAVDKAVLAELEDTVDTMIALEKQKEWLKSTSKHYDEIHNALSIIDKDMKMLAENIEVTILEAGIA